MSIAPSWDRLAKLEALYRASDRFSQWVDPPVFGDDDPAADDFWEWSDALNALRRQSAPRSEGRTPPPQAA